MSDTRVIAPKGKIGTRPRAATDHPGERAEDQAPTQKKSPKKWLGTVMGVGLIAVLAVGYWFFMGPGQDAAAEAGEVATEVEVGAVQALEPISLNLAGGHYLRLGLGLQLTADAAEELDPAIALDAAIGTYSGHAITDLADLEVREQLKQELLTKLEEPYGGDVIGIYYMDFVTQ